MLVDRVTVAYPGPRRVALSSIAFHLIRGLLDEARIGYGEAYLEDGGVWAPRPLGRAGLVLASLPYELMYRDLVVMLEQMGVPPRAGDRGPGDPIVLVGGPAVTANPLPVSGIADAVLVGEVEPVFWGIVEALGAGSRRGALEMLAQLPGVYVPSLGNEPVRRVYAEDLDSTWYPVVQEMPVEPVWGKGFMLETTRGCARGCRFCMEGFIFRPKRDRSLKTLVGLLEEGVRANRVSRVVFVSLAFFDNPHAEAVLEHAVEGMGLEVSVPSIRLETLNERRAALIARGGQRTITIAPETGSCRIARAINKYAGNDRVVEAAVTAVEAGLRSVKLYLITGFPGESDKDLDETVSLVARLSREVSRRGGRVRVTLNPFIPKPVTPLQWAPLADVRMLRSRIWRARRGLSKAGVEVSTYDPRLAVVQTILSRGGPELSEAIVDWAHRSPGPGGLRAALKAHGLREEDYTGGMDPSVDPPWHRVAEHPYASLKLLRFEYKLYRDNPSC